MIVRRNRHLVPRRVLIIKPSALGDVVTALPVLRGLRRTFPNIHTTWLVNDTCAPLIAQDSQLDEVVLFHRRRLGLAWRSLSAFGALWRLLRELRAGKYDWVIDLQGLLRSGLLSFLSRAPLRAGFADAREGAWFFYDRWIDVTATHTVDRNIALAHELGLDARPEDMTLEVPPEGQTFADDLQRQADLPAKGYLVCVPPTRWQTKQYPVRHWRRVIRDLSADRPIVILGTHADVDTCNQIAEGLDGRVINLAGQTDIPQMVGVISASAGVICCDSAAKFIAPAVGVDVVTLIGPTQIERTGPYRLGRAIVANVPCQGCLRRSCHPAVCMELIDPADVVAAARDMLAKP